MSMQPHEVLAAVPLSSKAPLHSGRLIFCKEGDKVKEVLHAMTTHHIACVPVLDDNAKPIGLLDMVDITALVAQLHGTTIDWKTSLRESHGWVKWNQAVVGDAIGGNGRCAYTIEFAGSFLDGARALAESKSHRVLVSNEHKQVVNVLTQSDVVSALHSNLHKIDVHVLNRPIALFEKIAHSSSAMHLSNTTADGANVLYIDKDSKAIEAFRLMHRWGFTALPVVDMHGEHKLVGTISARDVRAIVDTDDFPQVLYNSTALQFAQNMAQKTNLAPTKAAVGLSHTFREAIELLHTLKVHRLWVVNDKDQVLNVISLTDILQEVCASSAA